MAGTERTVTFVIHGVGAPKSHATAVDGATREFAGAWAARTGASLERTLHRTWTSGARHADAQHAVDYAVFTGEVDQQTHHIVECQWADLSRAPSGLLGGVTSLLALFVGLRVAIDHTVDATDGLSRQVGRLCRWALWTIEAPILALNLLLMSGLLTLLLAGTSTTSGPMALCWMGLGGFALGAVLYFAAGRPRMSHPWDSLRPTGTCLLVLSSSVLLAGLGTPHWIADERDRLFATVVEALGAAMLGSWVGVALLIVGLGVCWIFARAKLPPEKRRTVDAQVFVAFLAHRAWILALPMVWHLLTADGDARFARMGTLQLDRVVRDSLARLNPMLSLTMATTGFLFACFAVGYVSYLRRAKGEARARLLVSPWLHLGLTGATVAVVVVALWTAGHELGAVVPLFAREDWVGQVRAALADFQGAAWAVTGALAVAAVAMQRQVRLSIDFALDITNYLKGPEDRVQRQITARVHGVMRDALTRYRPSRVTVLSHSQGTVVAGELLRHLDTRRDDVTDALRSGTWITLGSPIEHLYGYYFAHKFWADGGWPRVGAHVGRWLNGYRAQDYIGGPVRERDGDKATGALNVPLGDGGHTGYFGDAAVLDQLEKADPAGGLLWPVGPRPPA